MKIDEKKRVMATQTIAEMNRIDSDEEFVRRVRCVLKLDKDSVGYDATREQLYGVIYQNSQAVNAVHEIHKQFGFLDYALTKVNP